MMSVDRQGRYPMFECAGLISKTEQIKCWNLHQKHGLSYMAYLEMLGRQDYRCAVCRQPLTEGRGTHLDHDHKTNQIRGILCNRCNVGIGYFRDEPEYLRSAAAYLEGQP